MALPRENRLVKKSDFGLVFKEGKAVKGSFLFIKYVKNKGRARFGFIVSKKFYPRAVARNRLRRILSELARLYMKSTPLSNLDIVVLVNKNCDQDLLSSEFTKFLESLN